MNWLLKAIIAHGNEINKSLGYEVYDGSSAKRLCPVCPHESAKTLLAVEMHDSLINQMLCSGCQCPLPVK